MNLNKQIDKIISKLQELKQPEKLEFEPHNFRINSDGWKKITVDDERYLVNPEEDIWEILDGECKGEQLFTWEAMMRETKKRNKRVPTNEEFDQLLKTKEDMPNLRLAGYRYSTGSFDGRTSGAYFWSSSVSGGNAWRRALYSSGSTVYRDTNYQSYGFSVRCLKD